MATKNRNLKATPVWLGASDACIDMAARNDVRPFDKKPAFDSGRVITASWHTSDGNSIHLNLIGNAAEHVDLRIAVRLDLQAEKRQTRRDVRPTQFQRHGIANS